MSSSSIDTFTLKSSDGTSVLLNRYPAAGKPRAVLLFSPALGIRASYYKPFAEALAASGVAICVNEQRGHGEHALRASRHCNYGYRELVEDDLAAAAEHLRRQYPQLPLIAGGHSLGGQLSSLLAAAHPQAVDGLLLIAAGSVHYRKFSPVQAAQVWFGGRLLFRPTATLLGYHPGALFGFGGREARRLMSDWSYLARTGRFRLTGSALDYEALLQQLRLPVLSISMRGDPFTPGPAARALTSKMPLCRLAEDRLSGASARPHPSNHSGWARQPEAVVATIDRWMKDSFPSREH